MEFDGYLTGSSEKFFHQRSSILGRNILLGAMLLLSPGILSFAIRLKDWGIIAVFLGMIICIFLLTLIPKSKKERCSITPRRIIVEDEYIVCIAERYTETRQICDVKLVRDFGEFYELCFPFGKLSDKFICQKSLLKNGSIQEFEAFFDGKIIRMR